MADISHTLDYIGISINPLRLYFSNVRLDLNIKKVFYLFDSKQIIVITQQLPNAFSIASNVIGLNILQEVTVMYLGFWISVQLYCLHLYY